MRKHRRRNRPPGKVARQRQTQTRRRDALIIRVEKEYERVVSAQERASWNLIEEWIEKNAVDGKYRAADSQILDQGEEQLLKQLRGLFKDPKNLRSFFGRMSSLVNADVTSTVLETVPIVRREELVTPRALRQYTTQNAALIKRLSTEQVKRLAKVVRGEGSRTKAGLQAQFQQAFQATESKAKFWARDQTLKLHAQITQERHRKLGIDRYFWTDSNDSRVREIHAELGDRSDQGETFSYKNPPVTSEDGRRNNPGEDFECRCTAFPDI